jgi:hypothetical protein
MVQSMSDPTNPSHYKRGGIEPIDYIVSNDLDFLEGNVIKYVSRYRDNSNHRQSV